MRASLLEARMSGRQEKEFLWAPTFTLLGYYNAGALSRDIVSTCVAEDFLRVAEGHAGAATQLTRGRPLEGFRSTRIGVRKTRLSKSG